MEQGNSGVIKLTMTPLDDRESCLDFLRQRGFSEYIEGSRNRLLLARFHAANATVIVEASAVLGFYEDVRVEERGWYALNFRRQRNSKSLSELSC